MADAEPPNNNGKISFTTKASPGYLVIEARELKDYD
jgi:hypothetical protein